GRSRVPRRPVHGASRRPRVRAGHLLRGAGRCAGSALRAEVHQAQEAFRQAKAPRCQRSWSKQVEEAAAELEAQSPPRKLPQRTLIAEAPGTLCLGDMPSSPIPSEVVPDVTRTIRMR